MVQEINARKKSSAAQCSSRFKVAAAVAVVATAPTTAKCVVYCDPNCKLLPTPNIRNSSFVHTHTPNEKVQIDQHRASSDRPSRISPVSGAPATAVTTKEKTEKEKKS